MCVCRRLDYVDPNLLANVGGLDKYILNVGLCNAPVIKWEQFSDKTTLYLYIGSIWVLARLSNK